jgi:hypothetical protein
MPAERVSQASARGGLSNLLACQTAQLGHASLAAQHQLLLLLLQTLSMLQG